MYEIITNRENVKFQNKTQAHFFTFTDIHVLYNRNTLE